MGSRLGRRVVHFANLPLKLVFPSTATKTIREFALRTIPSATKFEIKSVLESLYGFDVEEVRTLNMDGKKKKRGGVLLTQPEYKKAYVTLRQPLPFPRGLFPLPQIEEDRRRKQQEQAKGQGKPSGEPEAGGGRSRRHWLDASDEDEEEELGRDRWDRERRAGRGKIASRRNRAGEEDVGTMFPYGKTRTMR